MSPFRTAMAALSAKSAKARNPHFPMVLGWLGRQDSNLVIAESKSTCSAFDFNDHPEKSANFDSFPSNRLGRRSTWAGNRRTRHIITAHTRCRHSTIKTL